MKKALLFAIVAINSSFIFASSGPMSDNPISTKNVDVYVDRDEEGTNITVVAVDPKSNGHLVKQAVKIPAAAVKVVAKAAKKPVKKTVAVVAKAPKKVVSLCKKLKKLKF